MVLFESNDDYYPGYTIVYYGENPIAVQDNITYSFFYQPEETAGLKVYEYKYGEKSLDRRF